MKKIYLSLMALSVAMIANAQAKYLNMPLNRLAKSMSAEWYASTEALQVADSVMKYQFPSGGWAKNQQWHQTPEGKKLKEREEIWQQIHSESGVGSTIDNRATTTEIQFLSRVYPNVKKRKIQKKLKNSIQHGLDYLFEAQYDNGGWPQYYPFKPANKEGHPFYSNHITYNDNAMYNVMRMLRDIANDDSLYLKLKLDKGYKEKAQMAFDKGIRCILNTQIKKNGQLTVWCQQHDEVTLEPAPARSYELISFTPNGETVNLLNMLMDLPNPNDSVINAVSSAVKWIEAHAIKDMTQVSYINKEGKPDKRLEHKFGSRIWARYYDIDTEEPYVSDRDGVKQPNLEYIGYERRNGYGWYSKDPESMLKRYYKWIKKVKQDKE